MRQSDGQRQKVPSCGERRSSCVPGHVLPMMRHRQRIRTSTKDVTMDACLYPGSIPPLPRPTCMRLCWKIHTMRQHVKSPPINAPHWLASVLRTPTPSTSNHRQRTQWAFVLEKAHQHVKPIATQTQPNLALLDCVSRANAMPSSCYSAHLISTNYVYKGCPEWCPLKYNREFLKFWFSVFGNFSWQMSKLGIVSFQLYVEKGNNCTANRRNFGPWGIYTVHKM